jgi:nitrous oxide reductase
VAPYFSSPQIAYFYDQEVVHACCGSSKILLYSDKPKVDQVIVDFDLDKATFSFIDKQEMIKSLGIKPRNDQAVADYLVDLFILSGALFNYKISTYQKLTMEEIIDKLNIFEAERAAKKDTSVKTTG